MSKLETNTIDTVSGTTNLTIGGANNTGTTTIKSNNTAAITVDSSQNVGIGTTSPTRLLTVENSSGNSNLCVKSANTGVSQVMFGDSDSDVIGNIAYNHTSNYMYTEVNGSERMRITETKLYMGTTSDVGQGDNGVEISLSGGAFDFARNAGSGSAVFRVYGSSGVMQVKGDGDVENTNNRYGSISDRTLKENETLANSQWNDIKALQIKNYNLKEFPNRTHLGVIAQDLEASGMNGLVSTNDDGIKSVAYSVLYMKAVKALQEAITKIEELETRIQTLENA